MQKFWVRGSLRDAHEFTGNQTKLCTLVGPAGADWHTNNVQLIYDAESNLNYRFFFIKISIYKFKK